MQLSEDFTSLETQCKAVPNRDTDINALSPQTRCRCIRVLLQWDDVQSQIHFRFQSIQTLICNNEIIIYKCSKMFVAVSIRFFFGDFSKYSPVHSFLRIIYYKSVETLCWLKK